MSRSLLFAKEITPGSLLDANASQHVAVLAALDFVREDHHDRSTAQMFAALIESYWVDLSLVQRRTIAKALAERRDLPRSLVDLFLRDHFTVANPIIEQSPLIDEPDFYRIVDSHVMPAIRVLARRTLPTDLVPVLARLKDRSTALALSLNRGIDTDPETVDCLLHNARDSRHVARALALRDDLPVNAMMVLFADLDREARRNAVDLVERETLIRLDKRQPRPALLTEEQRTTMVDLSKRLGEQEFFERLNSHVPLDQRYRDAMLTTDGGDIRAILFAGLGFSAPEATTMLIVLGARQALAYNDVKDLVDLFERVRWRIAPEFVQAWRLDAKRTAPTAAAPAATLASRKDTRDSALEKATAVRRNPLEHGKIRLNLKKKGSGPM
ncbi:MAG: DUF2336 domain-containing protein [Pseudomonadota bacterium]